MTSSEYHRFLYVLDPALNSGLQSCRGLPLHDVLWQMLSISYLKHSNFTKMLCGLYIDEGVVLHTQHPNYFLEGLSTDLYFQINTSVSGQKTVWSTKAHSCKALKIVSHFSIQIRLLTAPFQPLLLEKCVQSSCRHSFYIFSADLKKIKSL